MDEYERYDIDGLKSNKTQNKYDRSRAKKRSNKDRSPTHSHRYVISRVKQVKI